MEKRDGIVHICISDIGKRHNSEPIVIDHIFIPLRSMMGSVLISDQILVPNDHVARVLGPNGNQISDSVLLNILSAVLSIIVFSHLCKKEN